MSLPACAWCNLVRVERRGALYCSHQCRQAAYRERHEIERLWTAAAAAIRHADVALSTLRRRLGKRHPDAAGVRRAAIE